MQLVQRVFIPEQEKLPLPNGSQNLQKIPWSRQNEFNVNSWKIPNLRAGQTPVTEE